MINHSRIEHMEKTAQTGKKRQFPIKLTSNVSKVSSYSCDATIGKGIRHHEHGDHTNTPIELCLLEKPSVS